MINVANKQLTVNDLSTFIKCFKNCFNNNQITMFIEHWQITFIECSNIKTLMNVERSFTVNCLFATFIKQSTGTFSDCFLMFQEYYFLIIH